MRKTTRILLSLAAGAAVMLAAGGCSFLESTKDAPREKVDETSPALVIQMPDGFSNIATKCVGGLRYSTIYHSVADTTVGSYGAVSVVADPACAR